MTVYRCNPLAATDGTGSIINPFNTWAGKTFAPNDVLLQDAGTEFVGRLDIGVACFGVKIGTYGWGGRARINCAGQDRCIQIREGADSGMIEDFELFGSTGIRLLAVGLSQTQVAHRWRVRNCHLHDNKIDATQDSNALQMFGNGHVIERNLIEDISCDAIWLQGKGAEISHNEIRRPALDGRLSGDCIQLYGTATLPGGGFRIAHNLCDHSNVGCKQAIIVQDTSGAIGGVVEFNECLMAPYDGTNSNTIYVDVPGATIRGNYVEGGNYGIFIAKNDARIFGNVVRGAMRGIEHGSTVTGGRVINNTVMDCPSKGIYADNDTTFQAYNNIILRCGDGISIETGAAEDYNLIHGCTRARVSLGGVGPAWGPRDLFEDPSEWIDEDGSLRGDAAFGALRARNPLANAGRYFQGITLRNGRVIPGAVPIGAYRAGRI